MTAFNIVLNKIKMNGKEILISALSYALVFSLFLLSGNGFILYQFSSNVRIFLYLIVGCILLFLFILPIKPKEVAVKIKKKELNDISVSFLFVIFFSIILLISFLANSEKAANANTYIDTAFVIICSFLFVSRFDYKFIVPKFNNLLRVIVCLSIIIFLFTVVGRYSFPTNTFILNAYRYDNYFFLNIFYNEQLYGISGSPRLCSIFWEPGVLGTFLLIGILNEICFKKTNYFNLLIFVVGVILTLSASSIIMLIFEVLLFLFYKLKGQKRVTIITLVCIAVFVVGCLIMANGELIKKVFPELYSKLNGSVAFTSRIYSPYYYLLVLTQNVKTFFLGMGGATANKVYYSIALSSGLIDSGTSTTTYLMASFGVFAALFTILPICGLFCSKKFHIFVKVVLSLLFILVFNKENHGSMLLTFIIIFYLIKQIPPVLFKKPGQVIARTRVSCKSIGDTIFSKSGDGVFSRNIFGTFGIRILSIFVSILTIPIYTSYFANSHNLDVWLVIYSVLSWILIFDFGFGNGMKNKLIESFSSNDRKKSKTIISNTYFPSIFLSILIFLVLLSLCFSTDLNVIFGDSSYLIDRFTFKISLIIISFSICLQFVLRNISFVYQAQKRNVLGNSFSLISAASFLFLLLIFSSFSFDKFIVIAIAYLFAMNIPLLIGNFSFFKSNPDLRPSFSLFSLKNCKNVMSLGIQYFIVQLCTLVLWSSNSILITHLYDPDTSQRFVYYYTCFYKIFSTIAGLISIISTTVWIEAGESLYSHNAPKIKKLLKLTFSVALGLSLFCIVVSLLIQPIFDLWLGTSPDVSIKANFYTVLIFASYCILTIFAESFIVFCNAFSRLRKQVIISCCFAIIKIPLTIILSKINYLNKFWEIVVLYNCLYSILLIIFLCYDVKSVYLKEKRLFDASKCSVEVEEDVNSTSVKEVMSYEIKI